MQLTLSLPGSRVCMLLLLSNLLFWENVASNPTGEVSTEDLYNRVVEQSHNTYYLASDVYLEFDLKFFRRSWFTSRVPKVCHTASIHTPASREEVHATKTQTEDLLKAIINIIQAWEEPLKYLVFAVDFLPGASDKMVESVSAVKDRNHVLREGLKSILSKLYSCSYDVKSQTEVEENAYPAWSGLKDLLSSDEDTHLFAVYTLCRCLKRDAHKIDTYLKVLRCREIFNNECAGSNT
ncbi:prolactin-3D4 isoform X1, partial [Sigmodon hispidus]